MTMMMLEPSERLNCLTDRRTHKVHKTVKLNKLGEGLTFDFGKVSRPPNSHTHTELLNGSSQ